MSDTATWGSLQDWLAELGPQFPGIHMVPRSWAANVLQTVGSHIEYGDGRSGYSPREVGWALKRVYGDDPEALGQLVQGFMEAVGYYSDGLIPQDLRPQE